MAVGAGLDVAVVAANVDERELDEEPERAEAEEGAERDGGAGCLSPDEEVEDEDCCEEKSGEERCGDNGVVSPI